MAFNGHLGLKSLLKKLLLLRQLLKDSLRQCLHSNMRIKMYALGPASLNGKSSVDA